ncbi:MAG TPA: prepilin peptidase [Myxococcota bacterium]
MIAGLVALFFFWSVNPGIQGEAPLSHIVGTAAFVFLIVREDLRAMRIPNLLTLPGLVLALGLAAATGGLAGAERAALGACAALGIFFLPFALRWLGAGDVKAAMVLGALWGPIAFAGMAWWMIVIGGLLAVALIAMQPGGLPDLLRRWGRSAWYSLRMRRLVYLPPGEGSVAGSGLPFAVAMGLGCAAFQIWGGPWN